jgi:glycosyltransferase involved in cell wall biosynthesis
MRVVQIIDSLLVGGAEQLQVTYAEAAIARGDYPTVITLANYPNTPVSMRLQELGVRVVEIAGKNLVDARRFNRLVSFLRTERFDAIHAHLTYAIILGGWAGLLANTPVVASLHNVQPDYHATLEVASLYLRAKRIIAVGDIVARAYQKRLPGRQIEVLYNPVPPGVQITAAERSMLRREIAGDESRPIIVCVGRLEEQKGMFDLLAAMKLLCDSHPEAILVIIGQGSLKDALHANINELGLQNHVRLIGIRNDVTRLLAASDIFALASHWEGMPVSVLEAMAARLPVVATRVGDMPQIVTPETGLLVEARQPRALAAALQILLDDPAYRDTLAASGLALVVLRHSPDSWLDSLHQIYSQL